MERSLARRMAVLVTALLLVAAGAQSALSYVQNSLPVAVSPALEP